MGSTNKTPLTTKNIKRGITYIVIGVAIVVIGASMVTNEHSVIMLCGLALDILGVLTGLYGMGYLTGILKRTR